MTRLRYRLPPRQIREAKLIAISGNQCSITFDGVKVIKGVTVVGDAELLTLNRTVLVEFIQNRPIVLAGGPSPTAGTGSMIQTQSAAAITNVVLSVEADTFLSIDSSQILDLDIQSINTFFAGPASGSAQKPEFRALSTNDLPTITASMVEVDEIGTATYDDVQDKFNNTGSAGYINGGEITDSGSGQIDIATLQGYIRSSDSEIGTIKAFDLTGVINFALTDQQTNYIYVDYDGGTPVVKKTTTRSDIKQTWQFTLGRVFRDGNDLHIVQAGVQLANYAREDYERLLAVRGFEQSSGGTISETGNRYIESDAGEFYLGHNIVTTAGVDTSGAPTFTRHYHVAAAWASDQKSQICAAAYQYDNGTQLTNLSNNKYGVWWVYIHMDGDLHVVVGGGNYTLSEAQASTPPATPEIVGDFSILAARIILEEDGTNFTAVASAYLSAFNPAGGIDHNDTSNKQGGTTDEYYHFTTSEHTELSE